MLYYLSLKEDLKFIGANDISLVNVDKLYKTCNINRRVIQACDGNISK